MKKIFFLAVFLFPATIFAQNVVVLQNGDTLQASDIQTFKKYIYIFDSENKKDRHINYVDVERIYGDLAGFTKKGLLKRNPSILLIDSYKTVDEINYLYDPETAGDHLIKAGKNYQLAMGLLTIGAGVTIVGSTSDTDELMYSGAVFGVASFVCYIIGNSHLTKAGIKLNKNGLNIKPSNTGVGLSLNF